MKTLQLITSPREFNSEVIGARTSVVWNKDAASGETPLDAAGLPDIEAASLDEIAVRPMTVGLIDCYRFSQECLIKALESLHSHLTIVPFSTVEDCIAERPGDLDLIIFYAHANGASDATPTHSILAVGQAFPAVPLVVMSDVDDAQQIKTIRSMLKSGAQGFIPTRTTGIPIAIAAIRLVKAGGVFAPMELMLATRGEQAQEPPEAARQKPLTSRQMAVLSHMQRGSANKIIAHELGMSESTVKVHVRNIMRRLGATNRTQAVYKAQRVWSLPELREPVSGGSPVGRDGVAPAGQRDAR